MFKYLKPVAFLVTILFANAVMAVSANRARIDFADAGGFVVIGTLGAACTTTDDLECFHLFGGSAFPLETKWTAANSDIIFTKTATGFVIPNDNADDDGIEFSFGKDANSPCAFTVGTSPAFYVKATFTIPDVSDYDVAAIGFRNDGSYLDVDDPADLNTTTPLYDDFALINVNAGDFRTYTQDDGATATDTDITTSTWLDTEAHTLMVKVSAAGVVTYFVDGAAAAGAVAFTLDSSATDIMVPIAIFAKGGTAADTPPEMRLFECGLQ